MERKSIHRRPLPTPRKQIVRLDQPLTPRDGTKGQKPGRYIRLTHVLKDAIIYAAQAVGEDDKGLNGLVGYLMRIAKKHPEAYVGLLAKVLPVHMNAKAEFDVVHTFRTSEEVKADLRARGIIIEHDLFK